MLYKLAVLPDDQKLLVKKTNRTKTPTKQKNPAKNQAQNNWAWQIEAKKFT